jgi:hypothetical protein
MNSGVLTKGLQVDPVTTINPRIPEEELIWVIKVLAFISRIYLLFLRIFFISIIFSFSTSKTFIFKIYKKTQDRPEKFNIPPFSKRFSHTLLSLTLDPLKSIAHGFVSCVCLVVRGLELE